MINPQWLELPISRTNFHCPKDVRAIEVRLYWIGQAWGISEDPDQTPLNTASDRGLFVISVVWHTFTGSKMTREHFMATTVRSWIVHMFRINYSWFLLSRHRLFRITAYPEVNIWSLPKHENLTTGKKYCGKEEKLLQGAISPFFHSIFNISLTSRVQLHIYLLSVVSRIIFSSILIIWYVEVRISRSISESPLEFEITRVDCTSCFWMRDSSSFVSVFSLDR